MPALLIVLKLSDLGNWHLLTIRDPKHQCLRKAIPSSTFPYKKKKNKKREGKLAGLGEENCGVAWLSGKKSFPARRRNRSFKTLVSNNLTRGGQRGNVITARAIRNWLGMQTRKEGIAAKR